MSSKDIIFTDGTYLALDKNVLVCSKKRYSMGRQAMVENNMIINVG
jgi:hypothetical protein